MTPQERAQQFIDIVALYHLDTQGKIDAIAEMIIADRQALQSEIEKRLKAAHETWMHQGIIEGPTQCGLLYNFRREIQSVFAQQSQPEAGKPEREFDSGCPQCAKRLAGEPELCQPKTCPISKAESDRRVLAEREACAKLADQYMETCYEDIDKVKGWKRQAAKENEMMNFSDLAAAIRARSNQEAEENAKKIILDKRPCGCTSFTDGTVKECGQWHVMPAPSIDQSARIATLQEWLATDARIIQQLNESNNALSLKVAQLEKEKNELTQKLEIYEASHRTNCDGPGYCTFRLCQHSGPATRKA